MSNFEKPITPIIGAQWGDEGKGKIIDLMSEQHDGVARFVGGPNAGHVVVVGDKEYKFRQIPSGILHPEKELVLGNGMVIEPAALYEELEELREKDVDINEDRIHVSHQAHILTPVHRSADEIFEAGPRAQGTTKRGMSFAEADKARRTGLRMAELKYGNHAEIKSSLAQRLLNLNQERELINLAAGSEVLQLQTAEEVEVYIEDWWAKAVHLVSLLEDTPLSLRRMVDDGKTFIAESSQGWWLDVDQGHYTWGSSGSTSTAGVAKGLGIAPNLIGDGLAVMKAFKSRVGKGPFMTRVDDDELANRIRREVGAPGAERGTVTGRDRDVGYLDLPEMRRMLLISGIGEVAITKLDELPLFGDSIKIATSYVLKDNPDSRIRIAPATHYEADELEPHYVHLPVRSADVDISEVRKYSDLPDEDRGYVEFIKQQLGVRVLMIGVGRARDQIIRS